MAEGILRDLADRRGLEIEALSAGVHAVPGVPPTNYAQQVAAENDVDIGGLRSRPLTAELVERASLVLTMERTHRETAHRLVPEAASKIVLLRDLLPSSDAWAGKDLPDPIGGPVEAYRDTYTAIFDALRRGWDEMRRLLNMDEAPREESRAEE